MNLKRAGRVVQRICETNFIYGACDGLECPRQRGDEFDIVGFAAGGGIIVVCILDINLEAGAFGDSRFEANFRVDDVIGALFQVGKKFDILPKPRPVAELAGEFFGQTQGRIAMILAALPFHHRARTGFATERCFGILDKIITDTGAEGDAIMNIRDGIMQCIQVGIAVKLLAEQVIILAESVYGFVVLHVVDLSIGGLRAQSQLMLDRFFASHNPSGEEQRVTVAARQRQPQRGARFPKAIRRGRGRRLNSPRGDRGKDKNKNGARRAPFHQQQ